MSEGLDFADNNARAVITVRNRVVKICKISELFVLYAVVPLHNGHLGCWGEWKVTVVEK